MPEKPIPITRELTLIGRDPDLCQLVFADPALEPLHCQLRLQPDGNFVLRDFHSTSGTWVNYTPVGQSGMVLKHGDLIQMGSLTFRFGSGSRVGSEKPEAGGASRAIKPLPIGRDTRFRSLSLASLLSA